MGPPRSRATRLLALLFAAWLATAPAAAAPPTVDVVGFGAHTRLTAAELAALPRSSVVAEDHGARGRWEGVAVTTLLARLGAAQGESLRGPRLGDVLLVTARDGYRVAYALAEFDPDLGGARAVLADTRDGQPLDAHEGPFRLVLPDEARPARWIRGIERIELHRLAAPTAP
ncbi:hypothetical protein [Coralloluteibacterium stylophorae]|uniref:Oxidoreductase molybdopterin-binding domain-containing protein n=2 Tax=Coralloluteibacterium stylophorae TaxID=1776034 RepID=A0AAP2CDN5_9GAMM|nr:hypothetical protein [Coralloluteibacterium stylophorae]MBS7458379.1 hypothetical protein [Coralloluteibacterium stylophorae]